ncbi:hypothetical protein [Pilimelia anulata]|nr:hypothetical protein [Pilimelia anulata]
MSNTPDFNGSIHAVVHAGDTVYVGGDFTEVRVGKTKYKRTRLAAIDADTGALKPWHPDANGRVRALTAANGSIYAGGAFSAVDGLNRDGLVRLDADSGAVAGDFRPNVAGQPYALAVANNKLYLGGTFGAVNGRERTRLAAVDPVTAALDPDWTPSADDTVHTMVVEGGRVYLGGSFHRINGTGGTLRMAVVSPGTGTVDPTFRSGAKYVAYSIAVGTLGVYAAHGGPGGTIAAYSFGGTPRWGLTTDGDAQAVGVSNGTVYFGGHFDNVCRTTRVSSSNGDCVDGEVPRVKLGAAGEDGQLTNWVAHGNGIIGVNALSAQASRDRLAVAGAFTVINGAKHQRFAQFP